LGIREWGLGKREWGLGIREEGLDKREWGLEKREWGLIAIGKGIGIGRLVCGRRVVILGRV
jgi:hypothetical protein